MIRRFFAMIEKVHSVFSQSTSVAGLSHLSRPNKIPFLKEKSIGSGSILIFSFKNAKNLS